MHGSTGWKLRLAAVLILALFAYPALVAFRLFASLARCSRMGVKRFRGCEELRNGSQSDGKAKKTSLLPPSIQEIVLLGQQMNHNPKV